MTHQDTLQKLLTEELPTGSFGGPYNTPPRPREGLPATSPEAQARHYADLENALRTPTTRRQHLQIVPDPPAARKQKAA